MNHTHEKYEAVVAEAKGWRAEVSFELALKDTPAPHQTIDHRDAAQVMELTWGVAERERRGAVWQEISWTRPNTYAGLIHAAPPDAHLVNGWTRESVDALFAIGERWHLNGMRAACAHQKLEYETDSYGRRVPSLKLTRPCPDTGYRYGHSWLVEPLPPQVEGLVAEHFRLANERAHGVRDPWDDGRRPSIDTYTEVDEIVDPPRR